MPEKDPIMATTRRVALLTGSARRIGAAIARRLHAAGCDLAIHHRASALEATALAGELERERPGSVLLLQADLARFDRLPELIAATLGRFGRLDLLVNNASAFYPTPVGQVTPAIWDDLFAANARAPFFLSQAAAPHLQASAGSIVNLVDIHALRPLAGHAVYAMAKAALVAMTEALALDLAPHVRVNAVAPGAILWPEQGKSEAAKAATLQAIPMSRLGSADEVAEAVRWLALDAHYTTGQVLRVDGGRYLS